MKKIRLVIDAEVRDDVFDRLIPDIRVEHTRHNKVGVDVEITGNEETFALIDNDLISVSEVEQHWSEILNFDNQKILPF